MNGYRDFPLEESYLDKELCIGHIKQLKERIDSVSKEVQQLGELKEKLGSKANAMSRRKIGMENHLSQLVRLEQNADMDVHPAVLMQLDLPLNFDLKNGEKFRDEMISLRGLLHELLLRTTINETNCHREQADQEKEFSDKIHDAIRARNLLREELVASEKRLEEAQIQRKTIYEEVCLLERKMAACQSETWLSITDGNRMSDHLSLLSRNLVPLPCDPKVTADKKRRAEVIKSVKSESMHIAAVRSVSSISVRTEQILVEESSFSSDSEDEIDINGGKKQEQVLPMNITAALEKILSEAMGTDCHFNKKEKK